MNSVKYVKALIGLQTVIRNKIMCKLRKSFPNFVLFVTLIGFIKM